MKISLILENANYKTSQSCAFPPHNEMFLVTDVFIYNNEDSMYVFQVMIHHRL